ncbi:MAG: hypothetical protein KG003_09470 [Bacteroidetes bacterium]|nr:hypothetical protein [Bacteroidota bacterium]
MESINLSKKISEILYDKNLLEAFIKDGFENENNLIYKFLQKNKIEEDYIRKNGDEIGVKIVEIFCEKNKITWYKLTDDFIIDKALLEKIYQKSYTFSYLEYDNLWRVKLTFSKFIIFLFFMQPHSENCWQIEIYQLD